MKKSELIISHKIESQITESWHNLEEILNGNLDKLTSALKILSAPQN